MTASLRRGACAVETLASLIQQLLHSSWSSAVAWFGGMWAVMLFVRKTSKDYDDDLNSEKRKALSEYLLRLREGDPHP